MSTLTIGLGQMLVTPGNPRENLCRAADMTRRAARAGCDLIVLPECSDIGWADLRARELACPIPGPTTEFLSDVARNSSIWIAAGVTERDGPNVFNAAVLIDRHGTIRYRHQKINELTFARRIYGTGHSLGVVDTEFGTVALNICADNYTSSLALADAQAAMGAALMLSPSSWAVPADFNDDTTPYVEWLEPYRLIGERHGIPVVGVSNVGIIKTGAWEGRHCIGRSLATHRDGSVASWGSFGVSAEELNIVSLQTKDVEPVPVHDR